MTPRFLAMVGIVTAALGVAELSSSPRVTPNGGFHLRNIPINLGIARPPRIAGLRPSTLPKNEVTRSLKAIDWIGVATVLIGVLTALVSFFKRFPSRASPYRRDATPAA
jgi:hypothetical protein